MRVSNQLITVAILTVLIMVLLVNAVNADVIFNYKGTMNIGTAESPITINSGSYSTPCGLLLSQWQGTNTGFTGSITPITIQTTNGYVIHIPTPMFSFTTSTSGTLSMRISLNFYISAASLTIGGTTAQIYPGIGTWSLSPGTYTGYINMTFAVPITSSFTLNGVYNYTLTRGVTFIYNFAESINPLTSNVMNLLNGYTNWYVLHVYQGDYQGTPTSSWPIYYGSSTAGNDYWYYISTGIDQPVLKMVSSAYSWSAGAMFWSESYTSGQGVTITLIGTYSYNNPSSQTYPYVGDGYIIYLFLTPTQWNINSASNYSIPYIASNIYTYYFYGVPILSPVQGDVMMPQSSSPYIVVEWNPLWQYAYTTTGAPGQWDVWIVSNPRNRLSSLSISPYPSPNLGSPYYGWDGIGNGYFQPNPEDYICISVTYNPTTNTLSGIAVNLNTGQSASFTLNLGSYFTPPKSGSYVFGVSGTNGAGQANWAILYVNYVDGTLNYASQTLQITYNNIAAHRQGGLTKPPM